MTPSENSKNRRPHRVPPAAPAVEALVEYFGRHLSEAIADRAAPEAVFDSPYTGRSMYGLWKPAGRVREASGVAFAPHDLRRTAASGMAALGVPRLVIRRLLNHADVEVTATYDRYAYDHEKRLALEAWAKKLETILSANANCRPLPTTAQPLVQSSEPQ